METPRPDEPSDEQLVEIVQRDPDGAEGRRAASLLLGRHARRVAIWCWRYVRDDERALDLAQEVMMAAHRGMTTFGGRSRFSSWLFSIARNRCLNELARRRPLWADGLELEALPSADGAADRAIESEQERDRLQRLLLEHLDPVEARALWLAAVERFSIDDITRTLKLENASGARGVLQRARRRLRAAMGREDVGWEA